ncbi:hypothetical protein Bca52824_091768 [Brassica carinata]|uniref:Nudix hydrolase domain-containing protein n=1 Tax=Brassica carinata TaxID=52824 RepID=A0A8X7NWZ3_BRACI|nr:hypothetical protein Bca52824_091768 [Brassica carinata]
MFIGPSPPHTPLVNRRNNRRLLRLSRSISRGGLSPLPLVISKTSQQILLPSNSSPPIHRHVPSISLPLLLLRSASPILNRSPIGSNRVSLPTRSPRGSQTGDQNVHNLWLELSDGETSITDSTPPVRAVSVVTVRVIGKNGNILVEGRQELSDGSVRERFRPLSEKMKPDETPEEAVFRAVREELGSIFSGEDDVVQRVKILPGSYSRRVEEKNSMSYRGCPRVTLFTRWTRRCGDYRRKISARRRMSVMERRWRKREPRGKL